MIPKKLSSKTAYVGSVFNVRIDEIHEADQIYSREIVVHSDSSVIVPVFSDNTIAMVRQYRHAASKYLLELPAGGANADESPENAALRELREEIGVRAETLEPIAEFYVSPGFLDEKMFIFLATNLQEDSQDLDEDEIVEVERLTFNQAYKLIQNGGIEDAKSIIGLIFAGQKLGFIFPAP